MSQSAHEIIDEALRRQAAHFNRNSVIEECARVAETSTADASYPLTSEIGQQIAAAIRALKEKV